MLEEFTGSEIATLDLAITFKTKGWEVIIATFSKSAPLLIEAYKNNIVVIDILTEILHHDYFDIIWAHHGIILTYLLAIKHIKADYIISSSLSPYEPLEQFPLYANQLSLCLANSEETLNIRLKHSNIDNYQVFKNSVLPEFFQKKTLSKKLQKVLLVSNHSIMQDINFKKLLNEQNIKVNYFGNQQADYKLIKPEDLQNYDVIITIGRTVQYALALGIPVYCYGRFGGPGYITPENIDLNEKMNFSGRQSLQQPLLKEIHIFTLITDIIQGYTQAIQYSEFLQTIARQRYALADNVESILNHLNDKINNEKLLNSNDFIQEKNYAILLATKTQDIKILKKHHAKIKNKLKKQNFFFKIAILIIILLIIKNFI